MQNEIKNKTLLLDDKGHLNSKGYAKQMNFIYNRDKVKSFPLKLKEWNFYQFSNGEYVLQLTIGHVSYMCSVSVNLINIKTGLRKEISAMKPFFIPKLDLNPEEDSLIEYKEKDFEMIFKVDNDKRILTFKGSNKIYEDIDVYLEIENDKNNEKMVIATPFKKKKQFYLNYKENYYNVNGHAKFDETKVDFTNSSGLIDWGRGVWPYSHEWYWGNLTSKINNVPFGFNIGWGFGDLSNATENMFFYDKKAYKLGSLKVERNKDDYMDKWILKEENNNFYLEFEPFFDNYTENKYVIINTHCNQLFGYFKGFVVVNDKKIDFENKLAFIEHAVNKW